MAEIFGAVAAGIAVGSGLIEFGRKLQRSIERIKDSRQDSQDLATETIMFADLYQKFLRACREDRHRRTIDALAVRPLIKWAEETLAKLNKLLRKVEGLYSPYKPNTKWEDTAISRIVWLRSARKVQTLRDSLSVARGSVQGFTSLMCLDKLKELLKLLENAVRNPNERRKLEEQLGVPLEDKICEVKNEMYCYHHQPI